MKFIIVIISVLLSFYLVTGKLKESDVNKDLEDLFKLLPKNAILDVLSKCFSIDKECKNAWEYLSSERAHQLIKAVTESPELLTVRLTHFLAVKK